jgi:hypothetical protein
MGSASSSQPGPPGTPPFLNVDDRVPLPVRDLLVEADGCMANQFFTGGTACAQRAVDAILRLEKADGATCDARFRALSEKHPSIPPLFVTILVQFGDPAARDAAKLPSNTLQLLIAAVKALAYELYVVGPERSERMQHVRRMLESIDRKAPAPADAAASAPTPPATPKARDTSFPAYPVAPAAPVSKPPASPTAPGRAT